MRRRLAACVLPLLVGSSLAAAPAPEDSWGKAGVSLAQYRQDSIDCAVQGYNLDISNTEDAKEFARASHELDNIPGGLIVQNIGSTPATNSVDVVSWSGIQQHIVDSVRPEERFKHIKQMQLAKTDECLVQRGYSRFRLTEDQQRHLRHLKSGSDERRAYLYSLASDPAVLAAQRLAAQP
jgi:hypothetical protein